MARAMGAGFYDAIMTLLEPKTYNAYVKNETIENALGAFTDFFQSPLLSYPKSVFWMECLENPRNSK